MVLLNSPRAFHAPEASLNVGSWSHSYADQISHLPWLSSLGGDGVHVVIIGIKEAIDKAGKDGRGEPIH